MKRKIITLGLLVALSLPTASLAKEEVKEEKKPVENQIDKKEEPKEEPIIGTVPMIGPPTVTIYQMKQWASQPQFQAHPEFINQAKNFYNISLQYGINPAITYAQAAKETNFFRFTGVVSFDFHNPCGLKITEGGANSDPNAHKRFKDWEEGITAQVHHLALYAGQKGFPKKDTPDPRHFPSIRGKAPFVEDMGGRWAPSRTYGVEIVKYMEGMTKFPMSSVERIQGKNRYETAAKINQRLKASDQNIVLASGESFADSLTATSLAKAKGGKLYLLPKNQLTKELTDLLAQGKVQSATLVGGSETLGRKISQILEEKKIPHEQIAGRDRYETALKVSQHLEKKKTAILANGQDFADTLSISAYAVKEGLPIYLSSKDQLLDSVAQELGQFEQVLIIGGSQSVSSDIENKLVAQGVKTERIEGADRYETSLTIARKFYPSIQAQAFVSGENFADALAAVALVDQEGGNIILTNSKISADLSAYLKAARPSASYVIGGPASVSKTFEENLKNKVYGENN